MLYSKYQIRSGLSGTLKVETQTVIIFNMRKQDTRIHRCEPWESCATKIKRRSPEEIEGGRKKRLPFD